MDCPELVGGDAIRQWSLGAVACYLLFMLTCAVLMTSSYSEGRPYPLQSRCGQIDEIGHVAVFLASPKASYMTGTDVTVDGGITAAGNWAT